MLWLSDYYRNVIWPFSLQTYNQSQSNKRSIYKAISGNRQVLHFYQGSPRMVPVGINPELHKMFITCGVYEPEKPRNLQRKTSNFSYKNGKYKTLHLSHAFFFLLLVSRPYVDIFPFWETPFLRNILGCYGCCKE